MDAATLDDSGGSRVGMAPPLGARTYALRLWPFQFLAGLATAVATLAMAVPSNAYTAFETGSALMLAIGYGLTFAAFSPTSPLGGLLADRWGPKKTLLFSNAGYLVLMAVALAANTAGVLPKSLVWIIILGRVACQSVQLIALETSVPTLLPKRLFSRANGSRMLLTAGVAAFEGPIANAVQPVIGVGPVVLFACLVVIVSIVFVLRAEFPSVRLTETTFADSTSIQRGYKPVWMYLRSRPGVVVLLTFFAGFNFVVGFVEVAEKAISDGFGPSDTSLIVLGAGLVGMIIATVGITMKGTPRDPVRWLFIFSLVFAAALVVGASRPNLLLDTAAALVFLGCTAFIMAIISTLLHTKTEPGMMGRMMGLKMFIIGIFYAVGNVVGALCSAIARSLMGGQPDRSTGFGTVLVGTGRSYGRGYALMTMVVGVLVIVLVLLARRSSSLRYLDTSLPDVTTEDLRSLHAPAVLSTIGPEHEQWLAADRPTIAVQSSAES